MATIRKGGSRYNVQIRKEDYPSITKTFTSISVARKWVAGVEADMERRPDSYTGPYGHEARIEKLVSLASS